MTSRFLFRVALLGALFAWAFGAFVLLSQGA